MESTPPLPAVIRGQQTAHYACSTCPFFLQFLPFLFIFLIIRGKVAIMINCRWSNVLNWSISKIFVSNTIQWHINHGDWNKVPLWIHYGHELKTPLICLHKSSAELPMSLEFELLPRLVSWKSLRIDFFFFLCCKKHCFSPYLCIKCKCHCI